MNSKQSGGLFDPPVREAYAKMVEELLREAEKETRSKNGLTPPYSLVYNQSKLFSQAVRQSLVLFDVDWKLRRISGGRAVLPVWAKWRRTRCAAAGRLTGFGVFSYSSKRNRRLRL